MGHLFEELKRRNVVRVAIAYVVVGWLIIEVIDTIAPRLGMPEWVPTFFIIAVLVGLPIVLLFSWAYEVTPEGVMKTEEVDRSASLTHSTGRKLDFVIIGALVVALGYFIWERQGLVSEAEGPQRLVHLTSIAVLPFVNMSADPEQEYFSDGITEELLNTLVRVPGLQVVARTSVFSYKGVNRDVREIGRELGVETIVEGSVRRAGDDLRITAQLVRVEDGFHLWSEIYDRKYENVFAIQEEIAFAIADAVQAPLGLASGSLVSNRMTNMAAYDQYLKARRLIRQRGEGLGEAVLILREVLAVEPDFAPAWAAMAVAKEVMPAYMSSFDGKPVNGMRLLSEAELAAAKAVALDPDLAEARHALANALRSRGVFAAAEDEYKKAYALDPTSIEILEDYHEFYKWVFYFDRAFELAKEAIGLEPNAPLALAFYGEGLSNTGRPEEAVAAWQKALEIQPTFMWPTLVLIEGYLVQERPEKVLSLIEANDGYWEKTLKETDPPLDFAPLRARIAGQNWTRPEGWTGARFLTIYAYYLGGDDSLLDSMEYYAFERGGWSGRYNFDFMARVRATERFKALALATGLVDYWRQRGWPKVCWPLGEYDFACGAARDINETS